MKWISGLCLAFAMLSPSTWGADVDWVPSFDAAKEIAARENKLIVLDVSADWCPPCRKMAREVYPDSRFVEFSKSQVFMLVDAYNDPEGQKLARKFDVEVFPTIIVINAGGTEIDRLTGGLDTENLIRDLTSIFSNPVPYEELNERADREAENAELQQLAGERAFQRDDFKRATRYLEQASRLADPADLSVKAKTLSLLAYSGLKSRDFEKSVRAISELESMDESVKDHEDLQMTKARCLLALDRNDEAQTVLQRMLRSESEKIRGEAREAYKDLPKDLRKEMEEADKTLKKAASSLEKGHFEEARELARRALELNPDLAPAHILVARACFGIWVNSDQGLVARSRLSEGYRELRIARRLSIGDVVTYQNVKSMLVHLHGVQPVPKDSGLRKEFEKAETEFASERYREAAKRYIKIINEEPGFGKAYLHLGDCYFLSGQYAEALKLYLQAISKTPLDPVPYRFAADASLKLGRTDGARNLLIAGVFADPDYPLIWRDLEKVAESEGRGVERHTGVIPVELLVPTPDRSYEASEEGLAGPTAPAWREYLNCKLQWRESHRQDDQALVASFDEEKSCLERLVGKWTELEEADPALEDADLDFLRLVASDGNLDCFIYFELFTEEYRPTYERWKAENQDRALAYLENTIFGQAQASMRGEYSRAAVEAYNEGVALHNSAPDKALQFYRLALRKDPRMLPAIQNASYLYYQLDLYDEARKSVSLWRRLEPLSSSPLELLAQVDIAEDNCTEAVKLLGRALELTDDPQASERISKNLEYCQYKLKNQ